MDPLFQQLIKSLLAVNLRRYLLTDSFKIVLYDNNLDDKWNKIFDYYGKHQNKLGDSFSRHEMTLIQLLYDSYEIDKKDRMEINLLVVDMYHILVDYVDWSKKKLDFKIFENIRFQLAEIGYDAETIDLLSNIKVGKPILSRNSKNGHTNSFIQKIVNSWKTILVIFILALTVITLVLSVSGMISWDQFFIIEAIISFIALVVTFTNWIMKK